MSKNVHVYTDKDGLEYALSLLMNNFKDGDFTNALVKKPAVLYCGFDGGFHVGALLEPGMLILYPKSLVNGDNAREILEELK